MKHSRRAFTLVEIMVASTVLLMVVGAALSVFVSINRSMYGLSDTADLNARTRLTQERVLFDLRAITKVTTVNTQSFSGEFVEYGTGNSGTLEYAFENNQLVRRVTTAGITKATVVMDGLLTTGTASGSVSHFLYRNRCGGSDSAASSANEVRAIQIEFVPLPSMRQSKGLTTGKNTAFSSALVQLRNVSG